jgi:hypothetical protein
MWNVEVALMDARPTKTMEEKKEDTTPYLYLLLIRKENCREVYLPRLDLMNAG